MRESFVAALFVWLAMFCSFLFFLLPVVKHFAAGEILAMKCFA